MHCDVAVIGTGPSGGAAANALVGTGLKVLMLEREQLPRYKPCGGAVPASAVKRGFAGASIQPEAEVRSELYLMRGAEPVVHDRPRQPILMYNRRTLDYALVQKALDTGSGSVLVRDGFQLRSLVEGANGVTLRANDGEIVTADFVVAADGATSPTARTLGLRQSQPMAVAVDLEVEVVAERFERESERALFDFFCVPDGYGWVFPKAGYLSCGILSWRSTTRIRAAAERFLRGRFAAAEVKRIVSQAHPIPGYCGEQRIATSRVCLVGDAARLVDPVIGEGIRYAMHSGVLAARAIIDYLSGTDLEAGLPTAVADASAGGRYQHAVRQQILPELDALWRFGATAFQQAPAFFYRHFLQSRYQT